MVTAPAAAAATGGLLSGTLAGMPADVVAAATGLTAVLGLSLYTIWRNHQRRTVPPVSPSARSGFTRWLTPMGMQSIPAAQAVMQRAPRISGGMKSIKVTTPVSKVSPRTLRNAAANPLEISRKTGLSRDAVAMMLATSGNPAVKAAVKAAKPAKPAPAAAPTRTVSNVPALSAPGANGGASFSAPPRTAPQAAARVLGTQFNARLS